MDGKFTLTSSVRVKFTGNKIKPVVINRLYSYPNTLTWQEVYEDVADLEDINLGKTDTVVVVSDSVSDKLSGGQVFEPDFEESIKIVQEFDKMLKYVTFTIVQDGQDDVNNNTTTNADAFDVLMNVNTKT